MISYNKQRITYLMSVIITILFGLASRKFSHLLNEFVAKNAGDVIWAMMVYFGFRFLFVQKRLFIAILFSFLFSFGIEFSQLYQADWINQLRGTVVGALVLGKGFLTGDLFRYTTGIVLAAAMDKVAHRFIF
jgi:glycopeptide antibiotics resistance protein